MRFDLHLRASLKQQIEELAETMKSWEEQPKMEPDEQARLRSAITFFPHTTSGGNLRIAGVDGSGEFPALMYGDSFVYLSVAQATVYQSDAVNGLREIAPMLQPLVHLTWLPEDKMRSDSSLNEAFVALAGMSLKDVIENSDYARLKATESRKPNDSEYLSRHLIRPHASDTGNLAIQLRSTAETGAALRVIKDAKGLTYILVDGTFSLPLAGQADASLFHEHLKRLCCVEARQRGIGFFALSKSHGFPSIELVENLAREKGELNIGKVPEHWYVRLPRAGQDNWSLTLAEGRRVPPPGAISYLVRFHKTTPVLRLDMDVEFWRFQVKGETEAETMTNEARIFQDLDYASHDQRCYGYPYPVKAAHDRASLTEPERVALRKQVIDTALKVGLKRNLFREASIAIGHA